MNQKQAEEPGRASGIPDAGRVASPAATIHAADAAEGLAVDPTATALLAVPLYTVTTSDRTRALEVCRSTYAAAT